ncbi:unnamed protein product, partial [Brachionus calyciflorus]
ITNIRDRDGNTILHYAVESNYYDIVELLLKHGAIFNAKNKEDKTPFDINENQSSKLLKSINEMFDVKDSNEKTPLDFNIEIIKNVRNNEGKTLLHITAEYGKLKLVKWFVEQGASPDNKDFNEETPLDLAIKQNNKNVIEYLKRLTIIK